MSSFHFKLFNLFVILAIFCGSLGAVTLQEFQHTLKIVAKTCQTTTKVPEGTKAILDCTDLGSSNSVECYLLFFADLLQKVRDGDYIDDQGVKVIEI